MCVIWTFFDLFRLALRARKRGGAIGFGTEILLLRQQLLVLTRGKKKCPTLSTWDRIVMGFCTLAMAPKRITKASIAISEVTLLNFHRALVARKYSKLFSHTGCARPGRKGPRKELIKLVVETKTNNPSYGCPKIALLVGNVLGIFVDEETVRRILKKHYRPIPGKGPSWLLPIGMNPNRLWSVDLFRLESVFFGSYWVLVVMDQFTRRIIGFSVTQGSPDGGTVCYLFNQIVGQNNFPEYLSSDNDPLFHYWLWRANLERRQIKEIKTVPYVPWSHPFIERLIGSCRREFTDRIVFWNQADLEAKLRLYQEYFNSYRVHYSHKGKTPDEIVGKRRLATINLMAFKWKSVCGGLYQTPVAA